MRARRGGAYRRRAWQVMASSGLAVLLCSTRALAHLMPAQQGTLNILDNAVFAALAIPVSAFTGVDDDGDGRLSQSELIAHATTIQTQLRARFHFADGAQAGRLDLVMPTVEADERDSLSTAGSTHMLVLMKSTFAAPPLALRVSTDLFGTAASERQLTLKATRGADVEAVILTPTRASHAFFRPAWRVLGDYTILGITHILGGLDHLLFLLTIVVAAAGWRYWAGVLTGFTVAHSITLTLAITGLVRVPASIVEPLIAASIVVMAVLNLRPRELTTTRGSRMALVFVCGLLHGLGFASAMTDLGLHGAKRVVSLVGFNLGIEVGQAVFLGALLAVGWLLRAVAMRLRSAPTSARTAAAWWPRTVSWIALTVGLLWFVQRLEVVMPLLAQSARTS